MKFKATLLATFATTITLILSGCGGGGAPTGSGSASIPYKPYPAPPISKELAQEYLNAVNEARAEGRYCGDKWFDAVPPLVWDDRLYRAAYEHNVDMIEADFYEHEGSGSDSDWTAKVLKLNRGSFFYERINVNGVPSKEAVGENIGAGYDGLDDVVAGWLDSPGHCENIMDSDYKSVGMANKYTEKGYWSNYWSQEFSSSTPPQ